MQPFAVDRQRLISCALCKTIISFAPKQSLGDSLSNEAVKKLSKCKERLVMKKNSKFQTKVLLPRWQHQDLLGEFQ